MSRAPRVCAQHGCPTLTTTSHCPTHQPKPWAGSTRRTRTSNGWQQQTEARQVMRRDARVCHVCGQPGATQVDHVVPVAQGGPDTLANKAPIHVDCHNAKTASEAAQGRRRANAN